MRVGCVYINAGKGHYIPAKAIADALRAQGVEAQMVDFFGMIDAPRLDRLNQRIWRWQLRFPKIEQFVNGRADHSKTIRKLFAAMQNVLYRRKFADWISLNRPDALICTHYMPSLTLPVLIRSLGLDIPVFAYASDVFTTPSAGLHEDLAKFYICTQEGVEHVTATGFPRDKTLLAAFPIQSSCVTATPLTKQEARAKLGLKQMFTLLINLGGEGIGTIAFLEALEQQGTHVQVVLVGGMREQEKRELKELAGRCRAVRVHAAGFVDNIYEYLYACDIVVGKAGINAMLEAIYLRRPFLVTTVYYTVKPAADYVTTHGIGWYAPDVKTQVRIISDCLSDPKKLGRMEKAFERVPVRFGGDDIARDLIETVQRRSIG